MKALLIPVLSYLYRLLKEAGVIRDLSERVLDLLNERSESQRAQIAGISAKVIERVKQSNYSIVIIAVLSTLAEEREIVKKIVNAIVESVDGFTIQDAINLVLDLSEHLLPPDAHAQLADTLYSLVD